MRLEEIIPERSELAAVYQYIKANLPNKPAEQNVLRFATDDLYRLSKMIADKYGVSMNHFKLCKSIEIFEELNLLKKEPFGDSGITITLMVNGKEKINLEDSALYRELQNLKSRIESDTKDIPAG